MLFLVKGLLFRKKIFIKLFRCFYGKKIARNLLYEEQSKKFRDILEIIFCQRFFYCSIKNKIRLLS